MKNTRTTARPALLVALALNACATGAGTRSDSDLARELADARTQLAERNRQYDQAYQLVVRQSTGADVSAEAARLPPPATAPRAVPPVVRPARVTTPVTAAPSAPVAAPPPAPVVDQGYAGGPPIGYANPPVPQFRVPRTGVVGNVGFSGPPPFEGMSLGTTPVRIYIGGVPWDVAIYVDDQLVCTTMDGVNFPRIVTMRGRSLCVSPSEPTQTRDVVVLMRGQNVQHRVRLVALATTTTDPVAEPIGQYVTNIIPARDLSGVIAVDRYSF